MNPMEADPDIKQIPMMKMIGIRNKDSIDPDDVCWITEPTLRRIF